MTATRPADEVTAAVLDTLTEMSLGEDGGVRRGELEERAVRPEAFANIAVERYRTDHPGEELDETGRMTAVTHGTQLLADEAVTWMLEQGHLAETAPGTVRLGSKPLKIRAFGESDKNRKQYIPGVNRERDLFSGMRRVTPGRLELIRQSIAELGDLRHFFPVLMDDQGNVVDGRHRRAYDPEWPASKAVVPSEIRVAVATAANRSNAWTKEDWARLLQHRQHVSGRREAIRTLGRLALLEDPKRSDREISRLIGCSQTTIGTIRAELERTVQIGQFVDLGGAPAGDGTRKGSEPVTDTSEPVSRQAESAGVESEAVHPKGAPRKRVLTDEKQAEVDALLNAHPELTRAEVTRATGLKANTAQRAMESWRERHPEPEPIEEPAETTPAESQVQPVDQEDEEVPWNETAERAFTSMAGQPVPVVQELINRLQVMIESI